MQDINQRKLQNSSWKELVSAKKHCNTLLRKDSRKIPISESPQLARAALVTINQELKFRKEERKQITVKSIEIRLEETLLVEPSRLVQEEVTIVTNKIEEKNFRSFLRKLNVLKEKIIEKYNEVKFFLNFEVAANKIAKSFNFSNKMNRSVSRKKSSQSQKITSEMKLPVVNTYKQFVELAAGIYEIISHSDMSEALREIESGTTLDADNNLDIDFTLRSLMGAGKEFIFISNHSDVKIAGKNLILLTPPELKIEVARFPALTEMMIND